MKTEVQPNQRNYGEFSWQMDFFEFKFDEDKEPFVSETRAGTLLSTMKHGFEFRSTYKTIPWSGFLFQLLLQF